MNMDRHKYRAWFNFADDGWRMVELDGFYYDVYGNGDPSIVICVKDDREYEGVLEECVLLQCTGLKDSEGSLIWESDIVQIWYPDDGVKYISPVMWKHGAWCIYHENRVDYETGERA